MDGVTEKITFYGYKFRRLVCKAKEKNKIKSSGEKAISAKACTFNYIPFGMGSHSCK